MAVDVESLNAIEFLMMLNYEGDPPPDPAFDKIRMTPEEWREMFPSAVTKPTGEEVPDDGTAPAPASEPAAAEDPPAPEAAH